MFIPKKIFVPIDFSDDGDEELAKMAIDSAVMLAGSFGASLHLCTCVPPISDLPGPDFSGEAVVALDKILRIAQAQIQARLDKCVEDLRQQGVDAEAHLMRGDDGVAKGLVTQSEKLGADWVVIPSHGRMGIKRVFLGSVAERVAHLSKVPVLILKP